jgi:hypothetical protein
MRPTPITRIPGLAVAACLAVLAVSVPAHAQQKPPAERKSIDPGARTKVGNALARSRIEREDGKRQVNERMAASPGGGKGCTTNIGSAPAQQPGVGQRFGAGSKSDQVIVVRGPVINVCK